MGTLYGDELFDDSEIERPTRRPLLKAASFAAIAALSLGGLYQGFRFTFRDLGPAPSYPQIASVQTPPVAQPVPEAPAASAGAQDRGAGSRLELAANDTAPPAPTDGAQSTPGAVAPIVPVDRAALIPGPSGAAQQGVTFDQPAPASPAYGDPAPVSDPPPQ